MKVEFNALQNFPFTLTAVHTEIDLYKVKMARVKSESGMLSKMLERNFGVESKFNPPFTLPWPHIDHPTSHLLQTRQTPNLWGNFH